MSKKPVGRPPGFVMSDSAKKLISAAHKGQPAANRRRISICGVEYASFKEASTALNIKNGTLRSRVLSQTQMWKEWTYA